MKLGLIKQPDGFLVVFQEGEQPNPGTDVVLAQETKQKALRALADWMDLQEKAKEI